MKYNQIILTALLAISSTTLLAAGILVNLTEAAPMPQSVPCATQLTAFYTAAGEMCLGKPDDHVCNGGLSPVVEPSGPVANSVAPTGSIVPVRVIESIGGSAFREDGLSGGLLWFRVQEQGYSVLLAGEATIRDFPVEGFPYWQNMIVTTTEAEPLCVTAPPSMVIIQNRERGLIAQFGVNGVSFLLDGTLVAQTEGDTTILIMVEGIARLIANGQSEVIIAGQQAVLDYPAGDFQRPLGGPGTLLPFDKVRISNLPTNMLDRAILIPQPGIVRTSGEVNLRSSPSLNAGIITLMPTGAILSVLGTNPSGTWYHVMLANGQTGWMFADLLASSAGVISETYQATPSIPQRYGRIGQMAIVLVNNGANIRTQPYVDYGTIAVAPVGTEVELLARSPYGPWVKIRAGDVEGWVALVALETRAVVAALPFDRNVVAPPAPVGTAEPTLPPGSTGNAFPDPSCWPNC